MADWLLCAVCLRAAQTANIGIRHMVPGTGWVYAWGASTLAALIECGETEFQIMGDKVEVRACTMVSGTAYCAAHIPMEVATTRPPWWPVGVR